MISKTRIDQNRHLCQTCRQIRSCIQWSGYIPSDAPNFLIGRLVAQIHQWRTCYQLSRSLDGKYSRTMEKCNIRIQCFLKEEIYVNRLKQCRSSLEQRLGGQSIAHGCTSHRWSITRTMFNPRFRVSGWPRNRFIPPTTSPCQMSWYCSLLQITQHHMMKHSMITFGSRPPDID